MSSDFHPTSLRDQQWETSYSTNSGDLVRNFYEPALRAADKYDRATGYFSSAVYAIAGPAMADFALRGGRARIICSPRLTEHDFDAITKPHLLSEISTSAIAEELRQIAERTETMQMSQLLAALVLYGCVQFRFALGTKTGSLFHDKVGVMTDTHENSLAFVGSLNETYKAWHPDHNHESFELFTSWGQDSERVDSRKKYFIDLWVDMCPGVTVIEPTDDLRHLCQEIVPNEPGDVLDREALAFKTTASRPPDRSRFKLLSHQRQVLIDWEEHNCRGIVKHATGSGKTVTSLQAIKKWIENGRPVLVVVPSILLLRQWGDEIEEELGHLEPDMLLAGGGNTAWRKAGLLKNFIDQEGSPTITLATIQTASSDRFIQAVGTPRDLLIVIDEIHRAGASSFQSIFEINARARLGLSATPERYGDAAGTNAINSYCGPILKPEFSIRDAIRAGRLCEYEYEIQAISLTEDEEESWISISKQIGILYARLKKNDNESLRVQMERLLRQRAKIAKKAEAKMPAARQTILNDYVAGDHWLVYCEDTDQLDTLGGLLEQTEMPYMRYHSSMEDDNEETLLRFRRNGGVLLAIGCLDEGIDIPEISHALILASSKNPRQYIQRRGRVLRSHASKVLARVYDLLVVPHHISQEDREMDSLVVGELTRAREFAFDANNKSAGALLRAIAIEAGLTDDEYDGLSVSVGMEDDSTEEGISSE